jgi:hypothetical protein
MAKINPLITRIPLAGHYLGGIASPQPQKKIPYINPYNGVPTAESPVLTSCQECRLWNVPCYLVADSAHKRQQSQSQHNRASQQQSRPAAEPTSLVKLYTNRAANQRGPAAQLMALLRLITAEKLEEPAR